MKQKISIQVLNPKGELVSPKLNGLTVPRPSSLNGKKIALLSEKPDSALFFNAIERLIKERYPGADIRRFPSYCSPVVGDNTAEVAAYCDVWLQGVKTSTSSRVDGDVIMEKLGKPGVSFSVSSLVEQKKVVSAINGNPCVRLISIPALPYFKAKADQKLMDAVAAAVFEETINALMAPLTEEEMHPADFSYDYSELTFAGETYDQALDAFQKYFSSHDMTDGFPVIPPTRERVDEMLSGISYAPDKIVGVVLPHRGYATVEKIAINAVMAGATPSCLPVIVAMMECITDPNFNQFHINTGIPPIYWISGPIVEELGLNNDVNYMGPGNPLNNTICRAAALCQINIGWRTPSVFADPGGPGRPDNFTNYLIPENLRYGPWKKSWAEERGYRQDESVVSCCEGIVRLNGPSECLDFDSFEQSLEKIADLFQVDAFHIGTGHSGAEELRYMLFMHPTFAHNLVDHGFTKASFLQWVYDREAIIWDKMSNEEQKKFRQDVAAGKWKGLTVEDCKPGFKLEPFDTPDNVAFLTAGGYCGTTFMFKTPAGSTAKIADCPPEFEPRPFMIKVIHGATMTQAGQ